MDCIGEIVYTAPGVVGPGLLRRLAVALLVPAPPEELELLQILRLGHHVLKGDEEPAGPQGLQGPLEGVRWAGCSI